MCDGDGVAPTVAPWCAATAEGFTHGPPWPHLSFTWWPTVASGVRVGDTGGERLTVAVVVRV